MKNIVIIGATTAIAIACARQWAAEGARFFLVARNGERLQQVAADLSARGATLAACHQLDIDKLDEHPAMLARCAVELGPPAAAVACAAPGLPGVGDAPAITGVPEVPGG